MKTTIIRLIALVTSLLCVLTAPASPLPEPDAKVSHIRQVRGLRNDSAKIEQAAHGVLIEDGDRPLSETHFTWGGEIGASVDLGGNDMSTFDVDVMFGYKNKIIKTLGVGAGIHRAFGQGSNFVPVYAVIRMYFSPDHKLFFLNLKGGYSFNSFSEHGSQNGLKGCIGIGCNLSQGRKANSHLILSCGYFRLDKQMIAANGDLVRDIFLGKITLGVNF